jgi:geranylgeranyl diphosphate synthase type II
MTTRIRRTSSHSDPDARLRAFRRFTNRTAARVDRTLDRLMPRSSIKPRIIHEAMRYTALSEGKRLRPAMVILAYEATGGRGRRADPVAAALEMVHAFSLIHDDLPAMDDDDFRRGKPSSHKVFGEGVAVLAGDALLTLAFGVLAAQERTLGPAITVRLVEELSRSTGSDGVIGGQVMDLRSEGKRVSRNTVRYIHEQKTGRLFIAALRLGALAAEASAGDLRRLTRYGGAVGLAFQIVDDILGAAGTVRELGRDPGRDRARGKVTYPSTLGFDASHRAVDRELDRARSEAARLPGERALFEGLVELVDRRRRRPDGGLLRPEGEA